MISELFAQHISQEFPHAFTPHQQQAAMNIGEFLADPRSNQTFILRGYAGTGKSSLVGAVVRVWQKLNRPVVLLAPTGRAAKVFALHANAPAYTIHKIIYREKSFAGEQSSFSLGWNGQKEVLFIVDEASMVSQQSGNRVFGTGYLMDDLIQYVYAGAQCRLMLVGDTAQLPPVGEEESPALQKEVLEGYGLSVRTTELTEVVRQAKASLVLRNATLLRHHINAFYGQPIAQESTNDFDLPEQTNEDGFPLISVSEKEEVKVVIGNELIDALEDSYRNWGTDDTIIITRSNKRANRYNNGIRARIFDREELIERGDLVMAVKNNYYWTAQAQAQQPPHTAFPMSFVANGDSAQVVGLRNVHEMHGFLFADATLRFKDYDDCELDCRLLLTTLQSESPSLTTDEANQLYEAVLADYTHIRNQRERAKAIRQDPYYNALQIKYAYAITCHKSQGGQWHEVYVDYGGMLEEERPVEYLRWLYTAFTRTSSQLYLVNWPESQCIEVS